MGFCALATGLLRLPATASCPAFPERNKQPSLTYLWTHADSNRLKLSLSSVIFCEALAIYGVILAIICATKMDGTYATDAWIADGSTKVWQHARSQVAMQSLAQSLHSLNFCGCRMGGQVLVSLHTSELHCNGTHRSVPVTSSMHAINLISPCLQMMFAAYAIFWSGVTVGLANLFCGWVSLDQPCLLPCGAPCTLMCVPDDPFPPLGSRSPLS